MQLPAGGQEWKVPLVGHSLEAELESGQGVGWARQHVLPSASPERQSLNRKCPEEHGAAG